MKSNTTYGSLAPGVAGVCSKDTGKPIVRQIGGLVFLSDILTPKQLRNFIKGLSRGFKIRR